MEVVKFIYERQNVEFEPKGPNNVMVNATSMAKIFGANVGHFTRLDSTKNFINACLKNPYMDYLGIKSEEELIQSVQNRGTWMHRILALKFAAWLNSEFEVWVYMTIDKVLNSHFREQQEAIVEKLSLKQQKEDKKKELLSKYPEMREYFDLADQEKKADLRRKKSVIEQVKQLQLSFFPPEEEEEDEE